MKFAILLTIFILSFNLLFAQQSFKEIDKKARNYNRHDLSKIKQKDQDDNMLLVYFFKADKRVFSVAKEEGLKNKKLVDSVVAYQFAYYGDTLRVWYDKQIRLSKIR